MSLNNLYFLSFVKQNKDKLINSRISKIVQVTKNDFYFFLIPMKSCIHVSLNFQNPFIEITDNPFFPKLKNSFFLIQLSKYLKDAKLLDISILNEDRIIAIDFKKSMDNYEVIRATLIIEFLTNHPNIMVLDENKMILLASHYTTLDAKRIISNNIEYCFPVKGEKSKEEKISDDNKKIDVYNQTIIDQVKKNEYDYIFKKVKLSLKQIKKRIDTLESIISDDANYKIYKEAGNYIYEHLDEKYTSINIDGETLNLDARYSLIDNANILFKKYKKRKIGLEKNQEFLQIAKKDLSFYENINFQLNNASLDDIEDIKSELENLKIIPFKTRSKKIISSAMPYHIEVNGTKIYYGKSNTQNNTLTFSLANKNYYFIHVKDNHGSHVVIFSNDPCKEVIQKACEIALYLSKMSCGDLMLADIKDVKKANVTGLVNVLKYQTVTIKSYDSNEIDKLLKQSNR